MDILSVWLRSLYGWLQDAGVKKNRHRWRFFWILLVARRCYVNLPLLHRLGAGMAKVKVAAKKNNATHVRSGKCLSDYNNNSCKLASSLLSPIDTPFLAGCAGAFPTGGCTLQTPSPVRP
ncbi:MAG: hypothetical protein ACLGI6_10265, partial [Gammaproteobacteria bacterium]